jgi:hypothetical protein
VAAWFAEIPAGMDVMIAMQKPNAIITNEVRTFRLDIFLTALVKIPN